MSEMKLLQKVLGMNLRKVQCALVAMGLFFGVGVASAIAADYAHEVKVKDMTFAWTVDGDKLAVKVAAPTDGWVGIGFNPTEAMKGANIVMGYVKNGKVKIVDEFGDQETGHSIDTKLGGSEDVTVIGGSEEGGVTTLEFAIPLDSGDKSDNVINVNSDTKIILAYGAGRDSFLPRHKFRTSIVVNLGSGAMQ
jgi:hypothetical protein